MIENASMHQKVGESSEWALTNPVLGAGEIGYASDTKVMKIGDGITRWTDLAEAHSQSYATRTEHSALSAEVQALEQSSGFPSGTNMYQAASGGTYTQQGFFYVGKDFPPGPFPDGSVLLRNDVDTSTYLLYTGLSNQWVLTGLTSGSTEPAPSDPTSPEAPPPTSSGGYPATYTATY